MIGSHIIFGAYGFWLPNDPRGSWSEFVGSFELSKAGRATKTTETASAARLPHDHGRRLAAKELLQRPAVRFTGLQAKDIGAAFGECAKKAGVPVWACAIMPDHVHLVVGAGRLHPRDMAIRLKGHATTRLVETGRHPFLASVPVGERPPKCFARGEWPAFLDTPADVFRAIEYVEQNPAKEGLPLQKWSFVTLFPDALIPPLS